MDGHLPNRRDEMLLKEYENAWSHYRHLEASRGQYLGFLFTVGLASTAYIGSIHGSLEHPWRAATVAGILFLVTALSVLTHINIRKFGIALEHYHQVAGLVRDDFLGQDSFSKALLGPRKPPAANVFLRSRLFTVQGTSELTPLVAGIVGSGGSLFLAIHGLTHHTALGPRVVLVVLGGLSTLLVSAVIAIGDRPYWVE